MSLTKPNTTTPIDYGRGALVGTAATSLVIAALGVGAIGDPAALDALDSFSSLHGVEVARAETKVLKFVEALPAASTTVGPAPSTFPAGPQRILGQWLEHSPRLRVSESTSIYPGFESGLMASDSTSRRPAYGPDADQAWFWTAQWQERERQADEDFANGRHRTFDDVDAFLADLDAE